MNALLGLTAVASFLAAAGVLSDAWQTTRVEVRLSRRIDRPSQRLDSFETTVQAVQTALVQQRGHRRA